VVVAGATFRGDDRGGLGWQVRGERSEVDAPGADSGPGVVSQLAFGSLEGRPDHRRESGVNQRLVDCLVRLADAVEKHTRPSAPPQELE
jgi:hypothetical protein